MNMHVGALQRAQDSLPAGPFAQERAREKALKKLRKLQEKAEAEIERLLTFLDAVDGYTTTELEDAVDDTSCDEDELEANLTGLHGAALPSQHHDPAGDLEQEHDGREPDVDDEDGDADEDGGDNEPSLCGIGATWGGENHFGNDADRELEGRPDPKYRLRYANRQSSDGLSLPCGRRVTADEPLTMPSNVTVLSSHTR
jgi:hypothetical protein